MDEQCGLPFGNTAWGADTGCRYQGFEIRVGPDFKLKHIWRIMRTGPGGSVPHEPLLDKVGGKPRNFDSRDAALDYVAAMFMTVGSFPLGRPFRVKGKQYLRIAVPNWKTSTKSFVPVLDLESFHVSEMSTDMRPDLKPLAEEGSCEPSSSVSSSASS